jgi:hypothetical protein
MLKIKRKRDIFWKELKLANNWKLVDIIQWQMQTNKGETRFLNILTSFNTQPIIFLII